MPTRRKRRAEETSLSKAVQQVLTANGCRVVRIQSGVLPVLKGGKTAYVHCAPKGTPDLLVIIPGFRAEHVWLEVKTKTSKQSKEQLLWEQWARVNGAKHAVVRSISEALVAVFEAKRGAA